MKNGVVIALVSSLLGFGCGDSEGSGDQGGGQAGSGGGNEGGSGALEAPVLDEVTPMHGALHLYWTNVTSDCDTIEGERMTSTEEFTNFFSVPGTVENEADDGATDPNEIYTYRVRCVRGEEASDYSNELSASPR